MYMNKTYGGMYSLEQMSNPFTFQTVVQSVAQSISSTSTSSMCKIYDHMGISLNVSCCYVETYLQYFVSEHIDIHSPSFKVLQAFIFDNNPKLLESLSKEKTSYLSKIGIHTQKSIKMNILSSLLSGLCTLLKISTMYEYLSFNKIVNYLEDMTVNSTTHSLINDVKQLRAISDKYFTSSAYSHLVHLNSEANKLSTIRVFNLEQKIDIDQVYENHKIIIKQLLELFDGKKFIDYFKLTEFKADLLLFQEMTINMFNNYPELLTPEDTSTISAIEFLASNDHFDEKIEKFNVISHHFPKTADYYSIVFFYDYSALVQRHEGDAFEMFYDFRAIPLLANEAFVEYLKFSTRKTPTVSKAFLAKYKEIKNENDNQFNGYLSTSYINEYLHGIVRNIQYYYDNENTLKAHNYNIIDALKKHENFEHLGDEMYAIVREHVISKYSSCLFSHKYNHLFSTALRPIFQELYNLKISTQYLQNAVGKKMASFKTSEELKEALESTLNLLNNFSFDIVYKNAKDLNAEIISTDDNRLIIKILNFNQSSNLGSPSWCISRNEDNFSQYTSNNSEQYFMYNFNKHSKENDSLIGCTLEANSKLKVAHFKNDETLYDTEIIKYMIKKVKSYKKEMTSSIEFITKIRKIMDKSIKVFS